MYLFKPVVGIAAAIGLAAAMATTGLAMAGTISGTQIEYVENKETMSVERMIAIWRVYLVTLTLTEI